MTRYFVLACSVTILAACSQAPAPTVDRSPTAQARVAGPGEYLVKRGDTLYRIARENGMDFRELAALNNMENPAALREGQILRIRPGNAAAVTTPVGEPVATPIASTSGVETRPLDATIATPAPTVAPSQGGMLREPRGGKEPYSDEALARLSGQPAKPPETTPPPVDTASAKPGEVEGVLWAWPTAAKIKVAYGENGNKGIDFSGKAGDPVLAVAEGRVLYVGEALPGYGKLVIVKHSVDHLSVYAHNSKLLVKEGQAIKLGQKIAEMGSSGTDSVKLHFEIRKQGKPVDPMPFLPKR